MDNQVYKDKNYSNLIFMIVLKKYTFKFQYKEIKMLKNTNINLFLILKKI